MAILDDFRDENQPKEPQKPNKQFSIIGFGIGALILMYLNANDMTSETELVQYSYVYMPAFAFGVFAQFLPLGKAFLYSVFTLPLILLFYLAIWPSL